MQQRAMPTGAGRGFDDVGLDGAHRGDDHPRMQLGDQLGQRRFAAAAGGAARFRRQFVEGIGAQIHQIAAGAAKRRHKIRAGERGIGVRNASRIARYKPESPR